VCIATYTRHSFQSEIEKFALVACFLKEWNEERAEAAVYVQESLPLQCEFGKSADVVDDAVGEVGCRTDQENGVAINETRHGGDVDLVAGRWTLDEVNFDTKIFAGFAECCVSCLWENPIR
jgi:hypothetical protein